MQQLVLNLSFTTSYAPADFVTSVCNQDAVSCIKNWREWPSYGLCVVGGKNFGKTHLCSLYHAEIPTAYAVHAPDLKKNNVFDIDASHIMIDDADMIRDETAFFHLINLIKERKGSLFLTAQTPPSSWKIRLPDLKSRLCILPVITMNAPDKQLIHDILLKLFSDRQIKIDNDLAEYILKYVPHDTKILHQLVEQLDIEMSRDKKQLSRSVFRTVLFNHTHMMNEYARTKFLGG